MKKKKAKTTFDVGAQTKLSLPIKTNTMVSDDANLIVEDGKEKEILEDSDYETFRIPEKTPVLPISEGIVIEDFNAEQG